jgi:predicted glycosyltransferase involved in capsule biosynthesis
METKAFHRLGGYDETFLPMGGHDLDLLMRSKDFGLAYNRLDFTGTLPINNTIQDKVINTGYSDFDQMNNYNLKLAGNRKAAVIHNPKIIWAGYLNGSFIQLQN